MRLLRKLTVTTLVFSAIAIGCAVSAEDENAESLGTQVQALPRADASPYDPADDCTPDCTNRNCGQSDRCFGRCQGPCPSGTVCGGNGTPFVCACPTDCAGKGCGEPDGCGGICTAGTCAAGTVCGGGGTPGKCEPLATGQDVECFVFNDAFSAVAGPSQAIYFNHDGQACIPDGTPDGACRRWFGKCRTTDPSHTPVEFAVGDANGNWFAWSDAVLSRHIPIPNTKQELAEMCIPGGPNGLCGTFFGAARTVTGKPVRCRAFEDANANQTNLSDRMRDWATEKVWADEGSLYGEWRKWFGRCEVSGCGDGICDPDENETIKTCPKDCKCGDGVCEGRETALNCQKDCACGNGTCDPGERASECGTDCFCGDGKCDGSEDRHSCPKDCGGTWCGDGVCNGGENCDSCAGDCGQCTVTTCSGKVVPAAEAQVHYVWYEDPYACARVIDAIATSKNEAEECVTNAGGKVFSSPTLTRRTFHTDPTNGCAEHSALSFSAESAATCAAAYGYTKPGPCPWPYPAGDGGVKDGGKGK
jgi:hypothetical protein